MAIKKTTSATPAPKAAANTKKVVFEPLPGMVSATEGAAQSQQKKLYLTINGKEYRVNNCTLHKGTPDEISFSFVNVWDDTYSVSISNPTVSQLREIQSMYTRARGFNVTKFGNKVTVYRMRVLDDAELASAYEK